MILGLLHQFHYEDQSESASLAWSNLFGATLQKHCYISNRPAAILKKKKINKKKKQTDKILGTMLTFSHFRTGSDKVLWLIILRNFFLRIRSFVDPGKPENYQNHKNVILRVLHPFYLLYNSTLFLFIYSSGLNSTVILSSVHFF